MSAGTALSAALVVAAACIAWAFVPRSSADISPTAHLTSYIWARNGLSDPRLHSGWKGAAMYYMLQPLMLASRWSGGDTIEGFLLARHALFDAQLTQHLAAPSAGVTVVLEVAAGLAARGIRFAAKHPNVSYVESDLPQMAALKRGLLGDSTAPNHRVMAMDVLQQGSLKAFVDSLPAEARVVVVMEGLVQYLPKSTTARLLQDMAHSLGRVQAGAVLADLVLGTEAEQSSWGMRAAKWILSLMVRRPVHAQFIDAEEVHTLLLQTFDQADVSTHGVLSILTASV
eukprot:TRINITY_DN10917_c0_g1_i1.p1 TRINITY_DN10917_c0_g1~~TRINITY_DN10917_c0_g1_i1.p1  ORF type:complete len:285 (+),score=86.38 TRINITY_DN10917_c0_g1_i1:49-903(+)